MLWESEIQGNHCRALQYYPMSLTHNWNIIYLLHCQWYNSQVKKKASFLIRQQLIGKKKNKLEQFIL